MKGKSKHVFGLLAFMLFVAAALSMAGCGGGTNSGGGPTIPTPSPSGNTYQLKPNVKLLEPGRLQLTNQTDTSMVLKGEG